MFKLAPDFWKSKTTWLGIVGILTAIATYLAGKESLAQAEQQGLIAFMSIFVRDAIGKVGLTNPAVPPVVVPPVVPPT